MTGAGGWVLDVGCSSVSSFAEASEDEKFLGMKSLRTVKGDG